MKDIGNNTNLAPAKLLPKKASKHQKGGRTELLITENLGLVYYLADKFRKFRYPESELDDLISLGSIGLIKASRTYDESKDVKFAAYAAKCINHEIITYYRNHFKNWINIAYLDDALNKDNNESERVLSDITLGTTADYENQVMDCIELSTAIQRIFNSLDLRTLLIYLADIAGWSRNRIFDQLGISQSNAFESKRNAIEKLTYKPKNHGEWEVSYYDGILSIHKNTGQTMHFSIDDDLWDNITYWLINTAEMPEFHPASQEKVNTSGKRKYNLMRVDRANEFGNYMAKNNTTIRNTAEFFQVSKSTVHKDIMEVLPQISPDLFKKVQKIIAQNKSERNIRGGAVNKRRHDMLREQKYNQKF